MKRRSRCLQSSKVPADAQFLGRLASRAIPALTTRLGGTTHGLRSRSGQVHAAQEARRPNEFGLPRKALYSTGDLCRVLGISWDRIRRMIGRGELPESSRRDANGHRVWSAVEMRAAIDAHGARGCQRQSSTEATG